MSNDKNADLDIMAEAFLPAELFTPSLGSNYGMDGYPDMEYGMGVLEGILDQEYQDAPAFPTGVQKGAAAEMDLNEMMGDEALADLKWLDPTQLQDPDRLPVQTVNTMIPELVEAWGVHHRTDGVHTAAHQKDLAHVRAMDEAPTKKKANARTIEKVVTHAMRRSVEGQHIERIVREAAESMGVEMERVVPLLRRVAVDHGLAGNVFIRASAYPGWGTGKWKRHANRHAKQARYIVVSSNDMDQATWIQDGRCNYTGKRAVTEVPWDRAYAHYAPRLEATGRKVASEGRESLRKAFLSHPARKITETTLPVEQREGNVDFGSAFRTQYDVGAATSTHAASEQPFGWSTDPKERPLREDLRSVVRQATTDKALGVVRGFLDRGLTTEARVRQLFATHKDIQKVAAVLSQKHPQERGYTGMVFKSASLNGTEQVVFSDESKAVAKAATENGVSANEIRGVLRTARRVMSEGFAGKDLTSYLTNRFSDALLTAAKGLVSEIRTAHEGLSGFVYVDAEAYASPAGVKGCESGSLKHRANQIQNVRAMPRCASCALARVREDGTRKCGAYNKTLVTADDVSGSELLHIKKANIQSAEMTDAETTASLFAPTYDPNDFSLTNSNLENVAFDSLPETEKLAEIMFDGWVIE